ncbi:MAG: nucleotidyl transferase AbiEii/AbiGii toxin family protein [Chthoniobacteraceae bacterium]
MPPYCDIFAAVAEASRQEGLSVLVIGGHAVNAYGYARTTLDADFLICAEDLPAWRRVFESFGYRWQAQTDAFAKFLPPQTDPPSLPVDIMLVNSATFQKLTDGKRELDFGPTRLNVPQPLHLIALKLHAMRNDERRRLGKDFPDIAQIMRHCGIKPGDAEFRRIVDHYANSPTRALLDAVLELG